MGAILLESIEGLGETVFVASAGDIWESLQAEKEEVGNNLLLETKVNSAKADCLSEHRTEEEYVHEVDWRIRERLEGRLRNINDARDRLMDGEYGLCVECGEEIDAKRLAADPVASRCLICQQSFESDDSSCERSRQV